MAPICYVPHLTHFPSKHPSCILINSVVFAGFTVVTKLVLFIDRDLQQLAHIICTDCMPCATQCMRRLLCCLQDKREGNRHTGHEPDEWCIDVPAQGVSRVMEKNTHQHSSWSMVGLPVQQSVYYPQKNKRYKMV